MATIGWCMVILRNWPAISAGRWWGKGRDADGQNNSRLSGYSADELAGHLRRLGDRLQQEAGVTTKPSPHQSGGLFLVSDDLQTGFARRFIQALDNEGSVPRYRPAAVKWRSIKAGASIPAMRRMFTRKVAANKVVLTSG